MSLNCQLVTLSISMHSNRARQDKLQCVVISLKDSFYEKADALVGVYKDKASQRSGTLTLDLRQYE